MIEKVKCKFCPLSEISLRREAQSGPRNTLGHGMKRYCTFHDKHVDPHRYIKCEAGYYEIKEKGPRILYPVDITVKA